MPMRKIIFLLFIGLIISMSSCREDFVFEPSTGDLKFSRDTIYLDTVFSNIGSSTYTLKVYNTSDKDIKIPTIQLGKGLTSKYRMTVDGMVGENNRVFRNVELLAKDSLYIFIEVTTDVADANPTDFLYTDIIEFRHANGEIQDVDLVSLIQDAYFLYPKPFADGTTETLTIEGIEEPVYGFFLDENDPVNGNEYVWGNDKPYVVYGYAAVPGGNTLTVQPGARVHFHADSGLIVGNGASFKANGTLDNNIIFEGDRLEPGFSDVAGQWQTIWLTAGSTNNEIKNVIIKNAVVGLNIDSNDGNFMTLKNTQIYNSSLIGLYAKTAKIQGENMVINTAGIASLACTLGGSYEFKHCTFNNNWASSKQVAVTIDNYYTNSETNQQFAFDLFKADFKNCIIFGSNQIELLINKGNDTSKQFNTMFTKCQIKFNNTNNQFTNNPNYSFINDTNEIIKNGVVDFQNIIKNKLVIGELSNAKGFGVDVGVPYDILGNARNSVFDLGAYNSIVFPAD